MAEYNPSKIIKDGNTYNFTDNTKIPLSGTNALSGSIVPSTDNSYDFGSSSYKLRYVYADTAYVTNLNINGTTAGDILTHNADEFVPRSGGAVMRAGLAKVNDTGIFALYGGTSGNRGALIYLYGKNEGSNLQGAYMVQAYDDNGAYRSFIGYPNGTLTWNGQPIQYVSDQRLKQQITEIDDKLLDAWEDVDLVQFKYNESVDTKGKSARLHTGYVVQQIDDACKSHNVDISEYGLYCHEEYPQQTEEVEVEQADGTKVKERKVIREASEHYSLRYTEALIVECAYLRKCIKELRTEIEQLKSSK